MEGWSVWSDYHPDYTDLAIMQGKNSPQHHIVLYDFVKLH